MNNFENRFDAANIKSHRLIFWVYGIKFDFTAIAIEFLYCIFIFFTEAFNRYESNVPLQWVWVIAISDNVIAVSNRWFHAIPFCFNDNIAIRVNILGRNGDKLIDTIIKKWGTSRRKTRYLPHARLRDRHGRWFKPFV